MSMRELEERSLPAPGGVTVTYTSPGGIAVRPYADGYLAMRVCLGHVDHAEDGLVGEVERGREPVPWQDRAVRDEAIAELRRRARKSEGDQRSALIKLVEHVRNTPYYEAA